MSLRRFNHHALRGEIDDSVGWPRISIDDSRRDLPQTSAETYSLFHSLFVTTGGNARNGAAASSTSVLEATTVLRACGWRHVPYFSRCLVRLKQ